MREPEPTLDFFLNSSQTALESYELSRLNKAANLRKELRRVVEDWIDSEVNARFARLLMDLQRGHAGGRESENPSAPCPSPASRRLSARLDGGRRQLPPVADADAPPAAACTRASSPPTSLAVPHAPLHASSSASRLLALARTRPLDQPPALRERSSRETRECESLLAARLRQGSPSRRPAVERDDSPPHLCHSGLVGALLRARGPGPGNNPQSIRSAANGPRSAAPPAPLRNAS